MKKVFTEKKRNLTEKEKNLREILIAAYDIDYIVIFLKKFYRKTIVPILKRAMMRLCTSVCVREKQ